MIFGTGFFDSAQGGDSSWLQHVFWYFGHPEAWLIILKWVVIIYAVTIIAWRLSRSQRHVLMISIIAVLAALIIWNIQLTREAHNLFLEGRGNEVVTLRIVNWATVFLSYAAAAWLIFDSTKKKRN